MKPFANPLHDRAAELRAGGMSLADIAELCGYADAKTVTALLKRRREGTRVRTWSRQIDPSSRAGSEALAARIVKYWALQGYQIQAYVAEKPFNVAMRSVRWEVKTDLVNGLPSNYRVTKGRKRA
jgi:hypothetical protein